VPAWIRRIVVKGLSSAPEDRYASMTELLAALENDPAARRRRWLAAAGATLAVVAVAVTIGSAARREGRACAAAADLSGAWDPLVKEDVRRAFEETHAPAARDSFERASKALDAYAATWSGMTTSICQVTKGGADVDEMNRLRSECLDRAKSELRGLTAVFARADRATVDHSVAAAYGLTSLSWCDDVAALRASPGLPADPKKRAAVQAARTALADASSLHLAGKSAEALAEAERALSIAREVGHRSTEAEAMFFAAHNRQRIGDYVRATDELGSAMAVAYGAKDDVVMIRTASDLAFVQGDKLYQPEEARRTLALASAGLERVGGGDELEADVLSTEALLLITGGHADQALPMLERVIRIDKRVLGETPTTAIYMNDLGYAEHLAGKNEDALLVLRDAQSMLERIYGADKFDAGIPYCNMGAASLALGRRSDADGYLHHALDLFDRENRGGFWSAWTLQYLAHAAMLDGDVPAALALGRRGLAIADRLPSALRLVPGVAVNTADALLASREPAEALALCERAVAVQERAGLLAPDKVLDWDGLRCQGEALLALGRAADAVAPLEKSAAIPRRAMPWDLPRAKLALARALDASGGDAARAEALRGEARAALAAMPQGEGIVAADEAWRRAGAITARRRGVR
jgi:tetratricopeptide (TPR) repeat protein